MVVWTLEPSSIFLPIINNIQVRERDGLVAFSTGRRKTL